MTELLLERGACVNGICYEKVAALVRVHPDVDDMSASIAVTEESNVERGKHEQQN